MKTMFFSSKKLLLATTALTAFPLIAATQDTTTVANETASNICELATGLNTVWLLIAAMLVFFMQPGFALVEAGFTRTKNTANILMKNCVDFMFGSLLFWFIGFGLMFGLGGFVGMPHFFNLDKMSEITNNGLPIEGFLIFQTMFCATSATIVSGAMAERTKFSMYVAYTIFISVLIYPISGHWTWGGGWLMNDDVDSFMMRTFGTPFHDFAGSTVVHSVGGWIALVGAAILGLICGIAMIYAIDFIEHNLRIDDPVGASSVHGVCGFLGTLMTGLLATDGGLLYGGGVGLLLAQLFGALVVGIWAASMGFIIFKSLDKIHGLRVPARVEEEGLDIYEHGETAYNT